MILNIAIIDDDIRDLQLTESIIRTQLSNYPLNYQISSITDPASVNYAQRQFSIIFLDIEMPTIDGINLAKQISTISPKTKIIFVTNLDHMVFDATKVAPFGFIRKSRLSLEIAEAIERFYEAIKKENIWIPIKTNDGLEKILLTDIIRVEIFKNTIEIHCSKKTLYTRASLKDFKSRLFTNNFKHVNRSVIINIDHIIKINTSSVIMSDNHEVHLHSKHAKMIKEQILMYIERI